MTAELLYFPRNTFSPRYGNTFFTYSIEGYHSINNGCCNSKPYLVYEIKVVNGDKSWIVNRRFSEFYELGKYYNSHKQLSVNLPPKTICSPSISDEEFIQHRMEKLDNFLDELLRGLAMSSRKNILAAKKVAEFLRLHKDI